MTHGNVKKSPDRLHKAIPSHDMGQPISSRKRRDKVSCVDQGSDRRMALRGNIERILDELDEAALSNALDAIKLCRYGMELELHKARTSSFQPCIETGGEMRIERSDDGSTYHLIAGDSWKILAAEEIASLLRIVRHTENESMAARRLWQWFRQERRDIALDLGIETASSERLGVILHLLKETFPVKAPRRLP